MASDSRSKLSDGMRRYIDVILKIIQEENLMPAQAETNAKLTEISGKVSDILERMPDLTQSQDIVIVNGEVDSSVDIEAPLSLSSENANLLAEASAKGRVKCILRVTAAAGASETADFARLRGSYDGSNYVTLQDFAPVTMDAVGEYAGPEVSVLLPASLTKIYFDFDDETLNGVDKMTVYLALRVEIWS